MRDIMRDMRKYVVYRTLMGDLDCMHERHWDEWVASRLTMATTYRAKEVSRGHTYTEAINLINFTNKLESEK